MGLRLEGPKITRVAVYNIESGKWSPLDLDEPASGVVQPMHVGHGAAAYQVGRFLYMYSTKDLHVGSTGAPGHHSGTADPGNSRGAQGRGGHGAASRGAEDHPGGRVQHRVGQVGAPGPGRAGQRSRPADGPGPRRGGISGRSIRLCVPHDDVHVGSSGRRCRRQVGTRMRPKADESVPRDSASSGRARGVRRCGRGRPATHRPVGRRDYPETEQPLSKTSTPDPNRLSRWRLRSDDADASSAMPLTLFRPDWRRAVRPGCLWPSGRGRVSGGRRRDPLRRRDATPHPLAGFAGIVHSREWGRRALAGSEARGNTGRSSISDPRPASREEEPC